MTEKMTGQVRKYIEERGLIQTGDLVVVGLSGGEDSVCLLSVLLALSPVMGFGLAAVHVHHGIRGAEADADMEFCRKLCAQWQVPFEAVRVDALGAAAGRKQSLEEAAREMANHLSASQAAAFSVLMKDNYDNIHVKPDE